GVCQLVASGVNSRQCSTSVAWGEAEVDGRVASAASVTDLPATLWQAEGAATWLRARRPHVSHEAARVHHAAWRRGDIYMWLLKGRLIVLQSVGRDDERSELKRAFCSSPTRHSNTPRMYSVPIQRPLSCRLGRLDGNSFDSVRG